MKQLIVVALLVLAACTHPVPPMSVPVPDNANNHPNPDDECPRRDGQPCK